MCILTLETVNFGSSVSHYVTDCGFDVNDCCFDSKTFLDVVNVKDRRYIHMTRFHTVRIIEVILTHICKESNKIDLSDSAF